MPDYLTILVALSMLGVLLAGAASARANTNWQAFWFEAAAIAVYARGSGN